MTNFQNNSLDKPKALLPTPRDCFDRRNSLSPNKLTPLRASLDNSISDFDEDDTKAQNQVLSSLKRGPEPPHEEFQSPFLNKREGDSAGLPPANPLTTGKYSLDADMLFGWRPKVAVKAPVPLRFSNSVLEEVITALYYEKKTEQFPELVYQGFRPDNTLVLHQKLGNSETYHSKLHTAFQSKQTTYWGPVNVKRPFTGMREGISNDCLVFDSMFEHGNMDTAIWKSPNEYDLFLRVDSNTRGHTNWYNFMIKNMKKGQTVKFNIMNLSKHDSLYQRGMKPYVYSERLHEEKGMSWEQSGENISFKLANISYLGQNFEEFCKKKHYKVSFEYTFPYDDDTVSFALCVPYSYTQLIQFIQSLVDTHKPADQGGFLAQSKLCSSLGGVDVPLLTITDPDESEIPLSKRQYIVCSSRVHPGEPNSSWMMQGFMNELLKNDEETRYLTKRFIFKIVPMLNPDGVILGNHRTGFCGNDLNRQYITPEEMLHPSVHSLKELIRDLVQEKKDAVFAYFDFHGHSLMKSVFMYGAEFPIHSYNYYKVKILPKLLSKRTEMFRFQSCAYTVTRGKLATARAVFSMHFGIAHSYTIEASYSSYLSAEKESVPFNEESFMKMGTMLAEGIRDYKRLLDEEEAAAIAFRAARLAAPAPNCDTPDLDVTVEEEGENNGEFDGDRKTKNKFKVKKGKSRKTAVNKKVDGLGDPVGNRIMVIPKERRSKTEPLIIPEINNTVSGMGIFSILEEIKNDASNIDDENPDSCENKSEDSDKGDADDDLEADEMKLLQENIISNIIELSKDSKEEKPDYKAYKIKSKKPKKSAEDKPKAIKEKKFLNQIAEKEALETSSLERTPAQNPRQNYSPPKSALTSTKYFQRAHNWITRIKQKTPLIPREVQMIVEKPSDSIEVQDQSINSRAGAFMATKNGFRRPIVSSYAQRKKQSESFEQTKKTIDSTYQPHKPGDIIPNNKKVSELKASIYEQSLSRPLSGYLMRSSTTVLPGADSRLGETNSGDLESRFIPSRQSSLKALLREPKCRSRSRFEKMEVHSLDQKDMRETSDNFTMNQIFYEEKECDKSVENLRDFGKTACGSMAPRITIVQAQMRADNVPSVTMLLKKDKKLPMAYVAYKNNIRLKKKIRDKKIEGH